MRKQDHLVALVHSLSTAEKKYFVQHATSDGKPKSYLQLYEALLKAEEYNAGELCRKLNRSKADLANEKKYLETILLKTLRACKEDDEDLWLLSELANLKVLYNKGLHDYGLTRVERMKTKAREANSYKLLGEICDAERSFLLKSGYALAANSQYRENMAEFNAKYMKCMEELKEALGIADKLRESSLLIMELTAFEQRYSYANASGVRDKVKKYLRHPLLVSAFELPVLQLHQYHCKILLYKMVRQFDKGIKCQEEMVKLIEHNPGAVAATEGMYFLNVSNLLVFYIQTGKFAEAERLINAIDNKYYHRLKFDARKLDGLFIPNNENQKISLLLNKYTNGQSSEEKVRIALRVLHSKTGELESSLIVDSFARIILTSAKLHLLIGEPGDALNLFNILIHKVDSTPWYTLIASARLLQCIAHQELSNYTILPSLVTSAKRFYEKNDLLTEVEVTTFRFLLRLTKLSTPQQKISAFKQLKKDYLQMQKNPLSESKIEQVNLTFWVERNLNLLERKKG